jgi:hypothetical protein
LIQFSKFNPLSFKNAVRFAWWTVCFSLHYSCSPPLIRYSQTEEVGLVGSDYYVKNLAPAEKAKIYANINMDMIASTNYILGQ